MAETSRASVHIEGLDEVLRALGALPDDADDELKKGTRELARTLAHKVQAAGQADSRQSGRAAQTVRAIEGTTPSVEAGPHPLLFGSEFGELRRTGWYGAGRYRRDAARQFRLWRGGASFWFFKTGENAPEIGEQWRQLADAIIRSWGA